MARNGPLAARCGLSRAAARLAAARDRQRHLVCAAGALHLAPAARQFPALAHRLSVACPAARYGLPTQRRPPVMSSDGSGGRLWDGAGGGHRHRGRTGVAANQRRAAQAKPVGYPCGTAGGAHSHPAEHDGHQRRRRPRARSPTSRRSPLRAHRADAAGAIKPRRATPPDRADACTSSLRPPHPSAIPPAGDPSTVRCHCRPGRAGRSPR